MGRPICSVSHNRPVRTLLREQAKAAHEALQHVDGPDPAIEDVKDCIDTIITNDNPQARVDAAEEALERATYAGLFVIRDGEAGLTTIWQSEEDYIRNLRDTCGILYHEIDDDPHVNEDALVNVMCEDTHLSRPAARNAIR